MNSKINHKKGFTLIELLVVVAIIGILAAVVLSSLGSGRQKGEDAAVKSNLNTIRTQSEIFYSDNGNSYLPSGGATFSLAACPAYNASGTNMLARDPNIANSIAQAALRGSTGALNGTRCYNSNTAWAVSVSLGSAANTNWCVDSSGVSTVVNSTLAASINGTTGVCN